MKKDQRRGRGGSYLMLAPDSARFLVSGTDQRPDKIPEPKVKATPEAVKKLKAQSTEEGAEQ